MRIQKKSSSFVLGLAAAMLLSPALTTAQASTSTADRAAPQVIVTPKKVTMGKKVTVKVSGFPASTMLAVTQCSDKKGTCDVSRVLTPTTNASGAATVAYVTHAFETCQKGKKCFIGVATLEGGKAVGKVVRFKFKP